MTNVGSVQVERLLRGACHRAGQRPDPLARNDVDGVSSKLRGVIARSAQRDEAISITREASAFRVQAAMTRSKLLRRSPTPDIAEVGVGEQFIERHDRFDHALLMAVA